MRVLVFAERLGRPLIQAFWRWQRGLTLGVRAVVVDSEGQVLLIEHTYLDGWFLPGGGVERAETVHEALTRELVEEAGVRLTGPAQLVSIYDNAKVFRGDHVLIFRVDDWEPCEATSRGEIARRGWFALDSLPEGVTPGTRTRLAEALGGSAASHVW